MTKCQNCARKCQLFLCNWCSEDLRKMLTALAHGDRLTNGDYAPGWLEILSDAALGKTRLETAGRHTPRYRQPLDGEMAVAELIEEFPDDDEQSLQQARYHRGQAVLRRALGRARINLRASEKLDYVHSVLSEWSRDICETRGMDWRPLRSVESDFVGPLRPCWRRLPRDYQATAADKALWLAHHVSAIAGDEGASLCFREIAEIVRDIERIVDRPAARRFCGPCPAMVADDDGERVCDTELMAKWDAAEVSCPARNCRASHNVDELVAKLLADASEKLFDRREVRLLVITANRSVNPRTFRDWFARGAIKPVGYRETVPLYRLKDALDLADAKPQAVATGAAAGKYKAT